MTHFDYTQKPQRPFGVSIAIVTGIILFTVLPLLEIAFLLSIDNMMVFDDVGRSGLDIMGIDGFRQQVVPQVIFALLFFMVAVFSWRGRPAIMRIVFSATIMMIAGLTIMQQILPRLSTSTTALDSSRDVSQPILIFYLVLTLVITLYSLWYMNRWASRAFYRGHYLPEDIETMKKLELQLNSPADSSTTG
jgi:hypothetical protein